MFDFDTAVKREAVNFATLMNALDISEKKLDPIFERFAKKTDTTKLMTDEKLLDEYAKFFGLSAFDLSKHFEYAKNMFLRLQETDEIVSRGSEDYPKLLAMTSQAPRFLYLRGNKSLLFEDRTIAIIGSRQASEKSKRITTKLTQLLGYNGIIVISGLARGIDVAAHKAALEFGFNTIAVIGTHLNQYYPNENKETQIEIEKKGLVVSQFSPATKTKKWFFPLRNGVMSGLSLGTVIMEASEASGSLIQADYALKQGREVFIPKSILENEKISWPRSYVEKGAKVVENIRTLLEKLSQSEILKKASNTSQTQVSIFDLMKHSALA